MGHVRVLDISEAKCYMTKLIDVQTFSQRIHDSPADGVISVAGAGSLGIAWLFSVPGASRTVLEVIMPYGTKSMIDFLGYEPTQYVSVDTAIDMARRSYRRALEIKETDTPKIGLGCTATIATDRPKRGQHRCCIATWNESGRVSYDLLFEKGFRDRAGEEEIVSALLLQALADVCGLNPEITLGSESGLELDVRRQKHEHPILRLLSGDVNNVNVDPSGQTEIDVSPGNLLLPGSFRPFHQGHRMLADVASEMVGHEIAYELSVSNVDKPDLGMDEICQRISQFRSIGTLVLTIADTFYKKAALFPGTIFVVGWDTAVRIVESKYYHGGHVDMLQSLAFIWSGGCSFLVAGRISNGMFKTLQDIDIPQGFEPMFSAIPESKFRQDISSTNLRQDDC